MNGSHLLATKFVQQIPAFVTEGFVRYRLDLEAAVRVERQKCASIGIDGIKRSGVGCKKHRVLLEPPLDRVAIRPVGESGDRHQSPAREICLNQVGAVLRRGRDAAKRKPHGLCQRGFSASARPDDASQALWNTNAQTREKPAADFDLLNDPHMFSTCQPGLGGTPRPGSPVGSGVGSIPYCTPETGWCPSSPASNTWEARTAAGLNVL